MSTVVTIPKLQPYIAFLKIPPRHNPRFLAQQGHFLVTNMAHAGDFIDYLEAHSGKTYLFAADVPVSCAPEALQDLAFMGLTAANMFPGLDGVGRMIRHQMLFRPPATAKSTNRFEAVLQQPVGAS